MRPILFHIGPFSIYSFGVMVALGVLLSLTLMTRKAKRTGFPAGEGAFDIVFVAIAAGFAGARLYYVLQNISWYAGHPLDIFKIWEGGLIFYGGMLTSALTLYLWARFQRISFWKTLDFIVPYTALTHAFGRIGCFLNGCCFGKTCSLPWAVSFPESAGPVHPTQLYEAAFDLALFLFLARRYDQKHGEGEITVLYFMLYAVARFLIEGLRENPTAGFLTINQWISIGVFALAAVAFYFLKPKWKEPHGTT